VRIGQTARRHGIADEDMLHSVRNPITQWRLDDDFAMRVSYASTELSKARAPTPRPLEERCYAGPDVGPPSHGDASAAGAEMPQAPSELLCIQP
jgi:hypothetical protein